MSGQGQPAAKRAKPGTSKKSTEERKRLFAEAYIALGENGKRAAIAAGYSPRAAEQQASRLLRDAGVQAMVEERRKVLAAKYQLTAEDVTRSIVQELRFDPAKLYNEDGSLKRIVDLDLDTRMALSSIKMVQVGSEDAPIFIKEVKWAQRQGARDQAMKFLGMYEQDNKQKTDPVTALLQQLGGKVMGVSKEESAEDDDDDDLSPHTPGRY